MNTPAHAIINLVYLGRQDSPNVIVPVLIGALLPDAPMFVFYFVEKIIRGLPENQIWGEAYYQPGWQNFIDFFNSVPLMVLGFALSLWASSKIGTLFFSSMMLHVLGDLPLHHEDAHRHFFPLSDWRFHSPVSYWDPNHYGHIVTILEILAVIISCGFLFNTYHSLAGKSVIGLIGLCYTAYFVYVFLVWM